MLNYKKHVIVNWPDPCVSIEVTETKRNYGKSVLAIYMLDAC